MAGLLGGEGAAVREVKERLSQDVLAPFTQQSVALAWQPWWSYLLRQVQHSTLPRGDPHLVSVPLVEAQTPYTLYRSLCVFCSLSLSTHTLGVFRSFFSSRIERAHVSTHIMPGYSGGRYNSGRSYGTILKRRYETRAVAAPR